MLCNFLFIVQNFLLSRYTPWYSYRSLISAVEIEEGITSVGGYAFCGCSNLEKISLPSSVTSINMFAFSSCSSLTDIDILDNIVTVGNAAFYNCDGLTNITIPGNVINIEEYAFALCDNLVSVTISEGVKSIGLRAFRSTALSGITIPSSVNYIGTAAFSNDNLEKIIVNDDNEYYGSGSNGILFSKDGSVLVECPCLLHKEYCEENGYDYEKTVFSLTIPDTVKTIEKDAFLECYYLSSINILGASEMGNYAFHNCYNLSSVDLPDSMESIGTGVFYNCMSLTSISIPYGITSIGDYAFTYCISLANITLPSSITEIGIEAFWKCYSLESITIPEGVTKINKLTFDECTSLKSIVLPKTLLTIESLAFYNCALLQTVYYCGTEDEWNNISINYTHNEVLKSAEIVYSYENSFDSDVEITVDNVSGGVEVSLFSEDSQSIYYTTDGTVPTTKSKTYESPFTLTNAGNYTVEAVAYNGSDYGSVYNESINIGQTTSPSISCANGVVTITAETGADIYYNTSLTPPTIGSNLYSGSFTISESTYVSAIAVKNGYAKSNTGSMYCVGTEAKEDYQPLTDSYSFNNVRKSFGYSMVYKIPESTYISVFGETLGKVIYNENAFNEEGNLISWKGSCFGMALTSALFYTNGLAANAYCDEDYENIYAIEAPGLAEASLTKLIERCQVSQFLPVIQTEMFSEIEDGGNWVQSGYGDLSYIVSASQNCMNEPIIIYMNRLTGDDSLYGHAVLPYKVENSSESEDVYNIYIYDCDSPNTDAGENYITVDLSSNTFSYYNGTATYDFSISYVKLSSLIEDDAVSLLQDDDLENNSSIMNGNFLFVANSKDISIYNTSGTEASNISGAVKYGTIGTDETSSVMWLLPDDDYTVVNNDSNIEIFEVKVVDETDSFVLSTDKVSSTVKFGRYGERLYISSSSSGKANIMINTYNVSGQ